MPARETMKRCKRNAGLRGSEQCSCLRERFEADGMIMTRIGASKARRERFKISLEGSQKERRMRVTSGAAKSVQLRAYELARALRARARRSAARRARSRLRRQGWRCAPAASTDSPSFSSFLAGLFSWPPLWFLIPPFIFSIFPQMHVLPTTMCC